MCDTQGFQHLFDHCRKKKKYILVCTTFGSPHVENNLINALKNALPSFVMAVNGGGNFEAQKCEQIHHNKCPTWLQLVNKGLLKLIDVFKKNIHI